MYINKSDYNNIGREALEIVQQSDENNRLLAEQYAIDYASGYLRGRQTQISPLPPPDSVLCSNKYPCKSTWPNTNIGHIPKQ